MKYFYNTEKNTMLKIILHLVQIAVFISLQIVPDDTADDNLDSKNKVEIQAKNTTILNNDNESKEVKEVVVHQV